MGLSDRPDRDALDVLTRDLLQAARARTAPAGAKHRAVDAALAAYAPVLTSAGPLPEEGRGGARPNLGTRAALGKLAGLALVAGAGAAVLLVSRGVDLPKSAAPSAEPRAVAPAAAVRAAVSVFEPQPLLADGSPSVPSASPTRTGALLAPLASAARAARPSAAHAVVAAPSAARESSPSLSAELALLDRIRAAIAAGESARAIALLDEHALQFPTGSMAAEAAVMRIEATARAGNLDEARRLAKAFCAAHAQSPYAARIASVVGANP